MRNAWRYLCVWYAKHLRGVFVRAITLPVSSHLVIAIGVGVQLATNLR